MIETVIHIFTGVSLILKVGGHVMESSQVPQMARPEAQASREVYAPPENFEKLDSQDCILCIVGGNSSLLITRHLPSLQQKISLCFSRICLFFFCKK